MPTFLVLQVKTTIAQPQHKTMRICQSRARKALHTSVPRRPPHTSSTMDSSRTCQPVIFHPRRCTLPSQLAVYTSLPQPRWLQMLQVLGQPFTTPCSGDLNVMLPMATAVAVHRNGLNRRLRATSLVVIGPSMNRPVRNDGRAPSTR